MEKCLEIAFFPTSLFPIRFVFSVTSRKTNRATSPPESEPTLSVRNSKTLPSVPLAQLNLVSLINMLEVQSSCTAKVRRTRLSVEAMHLSCVRCFISLHLIYSPSHLCLFRVSSVLRIVCFVSHLFRVLSVPRLICSASQV